MKKLGLGLRFFLAIACVSLLVSCGKGCKKESGETLKPGQIEPLDQIPANYSALVSINIPKLKAIPDFEKLAKDRPEAIKSLENDIDSVTLAINPSPDGSPKVIGIVTGKFDEAKVVSVLEAENKKEGKAGFKKETIEGKQVYIAQAPATGPNFTFISPTQMLVGELDDVKKALATKKEDSLNAKNKEVVELYHSRNTGKALWAGTLTSSLPLNGSATQAGSPTEFLKDLKSITIAIDRDKDLDVELVGTAIDATKAQGIAGTLNGLKSTLGMGAAAQDPKAAEMLKKIEITAQDKVVKVSIKVSEEDLQKAISSFIAPTRAPSLVPKDDGEIAQPPQPEAPVPPAAPQPEAPVPPAEPAPAPNQPPVE